MAEREARAYWVTRPGVGALRAERLDAEPVPGRTLLRTELSGISAGTERLVGTGGVPARGARSMACAYMGGSFALPVKYGYCLVGRALHGELEGSRCFVMHPHQDLVSVREEDLVPVPEALPARRALLIPNLETALNAVWDAELLDGERALVVGAGSVGLLVAYVLAHASGDGGEAHARGVTLVDVDAGRRRMAAALPWVDAAIAPEGLEPGAARVAFHASGHPAGLQTALDAVGFEGRVVELSWFGTKRVELDLGLDFHLGRKRLQASQVASVAPVKRESLGHAGRMARVLELLEDDALDGLLGEPVPFEALPAFMGALYRGEPVGSERGVLPAVRYGEPRSNGEDA